MKVTLIPAAFLEGVLPQIFPHISKAAEYTFGRYEPEDIIEVILDGDAHLWAVFEGDTVVGVTVTRFWQYPRKKCLDMLFIGGDELFGWKDVMLDTLQRWGRDSGCEVIESSGRPGFARVFKDDGYKMLWQVYELPVNKVGFGE